MALRRSRGSPLYAVNGPMDPPRSTGAEGKTYRQAGSDGSHRGISDSRRDGRTCSGVRSESSKLNEAGRTVVKQETYPWQKSLAGPSIISAQQLSTPVIILPLVTIPCRG